MNEQYDNDDTPPAPTQPIHGMTNMFPTQQLHVPKHLAEPTSSQRWKRVSIVSAIALGIALLVFSTYGIFWSFPSPLSLVDDPSPATTQASSSVTSDSGASTYDIQAVHDNNTTELVAEFGRYQADGRFILLDVHVTNTSDDGPHHVFLPQNQTVTGTDGKSYTGILEAMIYLPPPHAQGWARSIPPGQSADGVVVFDLPQDVQISGFHFRSGVLTATTTIPNS